MLAVSIVRRVFMKKFIFPFFLMIFMLSSFVFAEDEANDGSKGYGTYVVRKFEASTSKDNPGVLNVTSSYEKKTPDGNVIKDSKNESVDVSGMNGYSIKMNDDDAGWTVSEGSKDIRRISAFPSDEFVDAAFDNMVRSMRGIREMFDDAPRYEDYCDCYRCRRDRMMRNYRARPRMGMMPFWF